jgi:hypothetical protein
MRLHEPKGARSMQSHPQERIDSPKARSAFSIDKKESKGPLRKASTPLRHYKTE